MSGIQAPTTSGSGGIDHTQFENPKEGVKHGQASNDNTITQNNDAGPQTNGSPTAGARDAVTSQYKDVEEMVGERLGANPDFQELKEKLDALKSFENDFAIIDGATVCGNGDGIITLAELKDLMGSSDANVKAAAARLLSNTSLWNEVASGVSGHNDNRVGSDDVARLIRDTKSAMAGLTNDTRNEVKADMGIKTASSNEAAASQNAATAAQNSETAAIMTEAGQSLPKPTPSEMSGLEGASENLNNMIGWGESEIDRLTTLMGKTDDPSALKQLENKINQMTRRMQQMTALMNQIMTAMQNISKMYSDIAMNSVRNIR